MIVRCFVNRAPSVFGHLQLLQLAVIFRRQCGGKTSLVNLMEGGMKTMWREWAEKYRGTGKGRGEDVDRQVRPLHVGSPQLFSPGCAYSYNHTHRTYKYLDTLLANQNSSEGEATDHWQKGSAQDGGLPELLLAQSCLTNHSEAASLWLVTPKQVVGDHRWRVVCLT